jgi:multicomponent Na+:H+ antiporter subunit G
MIDLRDALTILFVTAGVFFMLIGSIGVIRLPDFFTRSHATSKSDTLGIMLILSGFAFYEGLTTTGLKLIVIIIFIALSNPVGSHALARAAYFYGIKPWFKGEPRTHEEVE